MKPIKNWRVFYAGDINAEYGGYFYSFEGWEYNYVDVARITPCSDAGGPDNCFWIEELTVNIRTDPAELARVISYCGLNDLPKGAARRHALVDCHMSYGTYDQHSSELVRIGKPDPFWRGNGDEYNPGKVLRGNASIRRYARGEFGA